MKNSSFTAISILLTSLAILSCEKKEVNISARDVVKFVSDFVSDGDPTQDYIWLDTDQIGVYMHKAETTLADATIVNEAANRIYRSSTTSSLAIFNPLNEEQTIYYPNSDASFVDFIAYTPYVPSVVDFTIPLSTINQQSQRNIDLLYSDNVKNRSRNNAAADFIFSHRLSKVTFTLTPGFGLVESDLEGLVFTICGTNTEASFSLENGGITEARSPADIVALSATNGQKVEAIIIPGDYSASGVQFKATLQDGTVFDFKDLTSVFVSGKKYNYEFALDRNAPIRELTGSVQNWESEDRGSHVMQESGGVSVPDNKPSTPTSNCYIVAPNSSVSIPVLIANKAIQGQIPDGQTLTGELVWTDGNKLSSTAPVASIQVQGTGPTALLQVNTGNVEGNAVVAVKANGIIKWSWHIWVTNYNPNTQNVTVGNYTFMDRNLGALVATHSSSNKAHVIGLQYQWGRKDPFIGVGEWSSNGAPTEQATITNANGSVKIEIVKPEFNEGTITFTVANPLKFLSVTEQLGNWYKDNTPSPNSLWGKSKTCFDPCPQGWRVPPTAAWTAWANDKKYISGTSEWMTSIGGGLQVTSGSEKLYFPTASYRSGTAGTISYIISGLYWSSDPTTAVPELSEYLIFTDAGINPSGNKFGRADAMNIRCIKE